VADRSAKRAQLERVLLYLITDARPVLQPIEGFLEAAIAGGVGMVQLRDHALDDAELLRVAIRAARTCAQLGVPLIINDRADIAVLAGADGVHLGQCDVPPSQARRIIGDDAIVGLSTHSPEQIQAAANEPVDYIGVGPIHATPTKPGRPAVGVELVRYAATHCSRPFFAIGGLDPANVGEVVAAGGRAVSVLRWVSQAHDPRAAAREMAAALALGGGHQSAAFE
jgi:thiamine-phosphate pyrophosphorylase